MVSHAKPFFCTQAIRSVLAQTYQDWELIVVDSGVLLGQGFYDSFSDPRIKVIPSNETAEIRQTRAIAPWCFNLGLRVAKGDLICYLCDDDVRYPDAFDVYARAGLDYPDALAWYGSIDLARAYDDGRVEPTGQFVAWRVGGWQYGGIWLDCVVDYLALCHRAELVGLLGKPFWSEDLAYRSHSDGILLEKIASYCPICPLLEKVGCNRRTPASTFVPC